MVYGGCIMLRRNFIPATIMLIIGLFLSKPDIVSEGAAIGLKIWVNNIVPFLFPMSVLSNILLQYNFLYSMSGRLSFISGKILKTDYGLIPFFISFVSGYPSGAMTVNTMAESGKISNREANYLTIFANNCSFQFIAGAVSFSMLDNFHLLKYIALPHFVGAVLLSFLINTGKSKLSPSKIIQLKPVPFHKNFSSSIYKSVTGILTVGGVIVTFSVFSNFLKDSLLSLANAFSLSTQMTNIIYSLLVGLLEMTNGCNIMASSPVVPLEIKLIIINFIISFSGMSVIFQTIAITDKFDLDIKNYILLKLVHGIFSSLLCIIMLIFT